MRTIELRKYLASGIFILCALWSISGFAQTKAEIKTAKKLFEGDWVNKKAKRHLSIFFDGESYATINDWQGKRTRENSIIDAYKAFVHQGKLVMPESKTDLRCPYCEIVRKDNTLLYRCREMNTNNKQFVDYTVFVKEKSW